MKQLFRLFLFLALCASSAFAQETNRGFFLPSSGDCGSINNPVTNGAACLQTITANNRTAGTIYIYKGSVTGWQASSGAGTVTDFSSGNLTPLFTTSVANSTSTPALSFSLSTAAANTVLGNASSSTAAPSYGQIVAGQIASNAVTTAKILDANVTLAKIANAAANSKLLGSGASGSGAAYSELTLGTNLSMDGTTLNGAGGTTPITLGSQSLTVTLANDTSTGTAAGLLIKVNSSNQAVTIGTSDTTGIFGICVNIAGASTVCGTSGSSTIAVLGTASCQFDGATTAGHFVIASTTSAGKCHDGGATYPATVAVLGTVQSTNGAGGTYSMFFQTPDVTSASNTPNGGGRGTSVLVNGSGLSSTRGSLNDTTPVATAGNKLVTWQKDSANPTLISAQVSASGLLDVLGTTRGSVAYRGASGWTPLVPSTAGFVLTDGGVGADPSWQASAASSGGALSLIQTQVATTTTPFMTFSGLDGNADIDYLIIGKIKIDVDAANGFCELQPNSLTTDQIGKYWSDGGTTTTTRLPLTSLVANGTYIAFHGIFHAQNNPNSQAFTRYYEGQSTNLTSGQTYLNQQSGSWSDTSTNVTSLRVGCGSSGMASGSQISLYKFSH